MSSKTVDFLLDIASENKGYSIGIPWRFSELSLTAIIPVVRIVDKMREYRLISEAKDVVKIKDTGSIDKMEITNTGIYPILVKAGEYVAGSTQTRVLAMSQLIFSKETVTAPCACVHSTKGIRANQRVEVDGYAPVEVRRTVRGGYDIDSNHAYFAYNGGLQQNVWGSVNEYSRSEQKRARGLRSFSESSGLRTHPVYGGMSSGSEIDSLVVMASTMNDSYTAPSEDLAGRVRENEAKYAEVIKKIPKLTNQVGIALVAINGLESMECFDHPESWEALRKEILKSEAGELSDISNQNGLFEFKADKAREVLRNLLTSKYDEKIVISKQNAQTILLEGEKFQGEVVLLNDDPIHCSFVKKS